DTSAKLQILNARLVWNALGAGGTVGVSNEDLAIDTGLSPFTMPASTNGFGAYTKVMLNTPWWFSGNDTQMLPGQISGWNMTAVLLVLNTDAAAAHSITPTVRFGYEMRRQQ